MTIIIDTGFIHYQFTKPVKKIYLHKTSPGNPGLVIFI